LTAIQTLSGSKPSPATTSINTIRKIEDSFDSATPFTEHVRRLEAANNLASLKLAGKSKVETIRRGDQIVTRSSDVYQI
jgi:hypothetical protein